MCAHGRRATAPQSGGWTRDLLPHSVLGSQGSPCWPEIDVAGLLGCAVPERRAEMVDVRIHRCVLVHKLKCQQLAERDMDARAVKFPSMAADQLMQDRARGSPLITRCCDHGEHLRLALAERRVNSSAPVDDVNHERLLRPTR